MISAEQARVSRRRNLVTRALGVDLRVNPELRDFEVQPGDLYLLCSDGLSDMVDDEEIGQAVQALGSDPAILAEQLGINARTLRRRLQERGSSFQRILDSVRQAVARDYLVNTELSIDQIAALVGFSEPTTFRSTFKRWTGQSAAEIRRARQPTPTLSAQSRR